MIQLAQPELFMMVVYLILNAFMAREILKEPKASYLHKLAFGSLILGLAMIVSISI